MRPYSCWWNAPSSSPNTHKWRQRRHSHHSACAVTRGRHSPTQPQRGHALGNRKTRGRSVVLSLIHWVSQRVVVKVQVTRDANAWEAPPSARALGRLQGPPLEDSARRPMGCEGSEALRQSFQQRIDTDMCSGSDAHGQDRDESISEAHPLLSSASPTTIRPATVPTASIVIPPTTQSTIAPFPSNSRSREQGCSAGADDGITRAPNVPGTACDGIACAWAR